MTTKLYLDKRNAGGGGKKLYPIKISINSHGDTAYIGTGIKVAEEQWDVDERKVVSHPLKGRLNLMLSTKKLDVDNAIYQLTKSGKLKGLTITEVKRVVLSTINSEDGVEDKEELFMHRFDAFTRRKDKEGTRTSYEQTAKRIREFDAKADTLTFADIDKKWLYEFDKWMTGTSPSANARNIKLRNIRTVFNDAINDGVTECYPFRGFKIRAEATKDRSIPRNELREIINHPVPEYMRESRDMFALSFYLCGINLPDLANLKEIRNGRIEFRRIKTGQPVSMRVPDEAREIINRYKGDGWLVNINNRYNNYKSFLHKIDDNLKHIGQIYNPKTKKWEGKPIVSDLSFYYARYSFATIAAELDIPEKTIAAALGHSTAKSVTSIYTRVDMKKKVDEASRKVIDYVIENEETATTNNSGDS